MKEVIISVIFFLVTLIISFIIFKVLQRKLLKNNQGFTFIGVDYLIHKFNLNKSKINLRRLLNDLAILNSLIIAFVSTMVYLVPLKLFWQLGIGFVLLIVLIYALYEIYGRYLNKKWGMKK